jgi:phosphohistidine swiveling domain-containing protein
MIKFSTPFVFGTKAETLLRFDHSLSCSTIPQFMYTTVSEWQSSKQSIVAEVEGRLAQSNSLAVRSSATKEDSELESMAGMFHSVLHVNPNDGAALHAAIDEVVESYQKNGEDPSPHDQILIQEMVENVSMSGVILTHEINSGAPYYIINYDDESGRTDTVSSGTGYVNRTLHLHRDKWREISSERFLKLIEAVVEIEEFVNSRHLDIEFAIDSDEKVFLLQVRKITTTRDWRKDLKLRVNDTLGHLESVVEARNKPLPGVVGSSSIYGKMSDWNPAEMIGDTPRPLAFSLYRQLITDSSWRIARRMMGYREPRGWPLMMSFGGQPFIDVRLSFNSLVPGDLPDDVSDKLVNAWLARLADNPDLHDKIEFEVAMTVANFDFRERMDFLYPRLLTETEFKMYQDALSKQTRALITGAVASLSECMNKISQLQARHEQLLSYNQPSLALVKTLIEDCIELGTIPFSILARHAFIANDLLRSLVRTAVLDVEQVEHFHRSIPTVASNFIQDLKEMDDFEALSKRYGHLRPGTYDIRSPRYDHNPQFFAEIRSSDNNPSATEDSFSLTSEQKRKIGEMLEKLDYKISPEELFDYMRTAIQQREYSKFIFTRNLSDLLEVLASWGEAIGLSRDDLSFLSIQDTLDTMTVNQGRSLDSHLHGLIERGRAEHEISSAIHLPLLIRSSPDLYVIPLRVGQPNFITRNSVNGESILLAGMESDTDIVDGKIVLIEGADPGYDWIFSRPVLGLITKYGGANSHMAIRCAEFGLPAAIGCGEQIFDRLENNKHVVLDCAQGRVVPLNG